MQRVRCYLLGERAAVLEVEPPLTLASQQRIWGLARRLAKVPEVVEAIPGMNNITVILADPQAMAYEALDRLQRWWEESETVDAECHRIEIPVVYGGEVGPDLQEVARLTDMTEKQVVELHASVNYTVYFLGFQPGFPYLGGLPEALQVPRRTDPRLRVTAGTVGIGGGQTGIYPLETPGGWQLIGRTALCLFDPSRPSPALLAPGDCVRFVPQREGVC